MNFLFDSTLARKMAKVMGGFLSPHHRVVHVKDQFGGDRDDCAWLTQLPPDENWIIITADPRVGNNPHELAAWKEAGHTIFFLKPGWVKLNFWEQAKKFVKYFPEMIRQAEQAKRGSTFYISTNGRIES